MKPTFLHPPVKVWYKALPLLPKVPWPILDIKLSGDGLFLPQAILSLVDSGASISVLRPDLAQVLGFDIRKLGQPLKGTSVSGHYKSWLLPKPIDVDIYGHRFSFVFEVIDNPDLIWPCILGEDSIFQVAKIDFVKYKGFFEIRFRQDLH